MKRVALIAVALGLGALPALAASPKIESAIKVFKAVAADPAKLKTFCEMSKLMNAASDKADPAADAKIDGYMNQLGADFSTAWTASEGLDEKSPDNTAFNTAIDELSAKCP